MKKSIIAMAVAGALAVPAIASADATLYGRLSVGVVKDTSTKANIGENGELPNLFGVRGSSDVGMDGTVGIYNFEYGVGDTQNSNPTLRTANVGLTGDWGTVLGGSMSALHDGWARDVASPMNSQVADYVTIGQGFSPARVDRTVAYVSPSFSGFQFGTAIAASSAASDKSVDWYHAAARYTYEGLYIGLSHLHYASDVFKNELNGPLTAPMSSDEYDADRSIPAKAATALGVSYDFGVASIAAGYSHINLQDDGNYKPWNLGATYNVTEATTLAVTYANHRDVGKAWAAEVQHDLSNMAHVWVGYGRANSDLRDEESIGLAKNRVTAGMQINF